MWGFFNKVVCQVQYPARALLARLTRGEVILKSVDVSDSLS